MKNRSLIITIIFAVISISGSMIFVGLRFNQTGNGISTEVLEQKIEVGILKFIEKRRNNAQEKKASAAIKNLRPVSADRDHILGNPDAEISLIEYSDFECPFCKRFHPTPGKILAKYKGKVNWVYRHFPLGFHNPLAQKEAEASECANEIGGNTKFWEYADLIYLRTQSNGKGLPMEALIPMAGEIGLDIIEFEKCFKSEKYAGKVREDYKNGVSIGITGTPGNILINHRTKKVVVKPGALPFEDFVEEIDKMLL